MNTLEEGVDNWQCPDPDCNASLNKQEIERRLLDLVNRRLISYQMQDLKKVVPPKREILKGIWLSFYWGAKIGVLGLNGAGKSTLLKIMAGVETEFDGEAFPHKKARVGFLPQEPELDPAKTVLENVMEGVGEVRDLLGAQHGDVGEAAERTACALIDQVLVRLVVDLLERQAVALARDADGAEDDVYGVVHDAR